MNKDFPSCQKIQEDFLSYLLGKLDSTSSLLVEKHVAVCRNCQMAFRAEKQCLSLLKQLPEVNPPTSLRSRVKSQLQHTRFAPSRWVNPWIWKGGLAVVFASVLLLWVWLPWQKSAPAPGPEPSAIEKAFFIQLDEPSQVMATLVSEAVEEEAPD